MRSLQITLALIIPLAAAPSNITVRANYSTQQAICYNADDNNTTPYTVIVATDAGLTNVLEDFNGSLFTGSNVDLTRSDTLIEGGPDHVRCIQVGHLLEYANDGKAYPRNTPAATPLYYSIGGVTGNYTTLNQPLQQSYGRTLLPDPNTAGATFQPYISWVDRTQRIRDWRTGFNIERLELPGDVTYNQPKSAAGCTGTFATVIECTYRIDENTGIFSRVPAVNAVAAYLKSASCTANCGAAGARDVEVRMSYDHVNYSSWVTATLGTSPADQLVYPDGTSTPAFGVAFPGLKMMPTNSITWQPESLSNSGGSSTVSLSGTGVCPNLIDGSKLQVNSTSAYRIVSHNCAATPDTITLNGGIDVSNTGFGIYTGWTDNAGLTFQIRQKNPGTGSTLSLSTVDLFLNGGWSPSCSASGGFITFAQTPTYGGAHTHLLDCGYQIYAWNDQTNQSILVGSNYTNCGGALDSYVSAGTNLGSITWSNTTGGLLYGGGRQGGKYVIFRLQFTGDPTVPISTIDADSPWLTVFPNTCTVLTPASGGHDVNSLVQGYDAAWTSAWQSVYLGWELNAVTENDDLAVVVRRSGQDTTSYGMIFRPGNGLPIGSGGTGAVIAGNFMFKFANQPAYNFSNSMSGTHTFFNCNNCGTRFAWQSSGKKGDGDPPTPGNQQFFTTLVDYCADTVQPSDPASCTSWVAGLPVKTQGTEQWIHVTSSWNPAWGTQPAGYSTGDLVTQCATTVAPCVAIDRWLNGYRVGDFLSKNYYNIPEVLRITDIGAVDPTGRPLKVKRGIFYDEDPTYFQPITWAGGAQLYGQANGGSGYIWDYAASPDGTDPDAFHLISCQGGGHQSVKNEYLTCAPTFLGYDTIDLDTAPQLLTNRDPTRAFNIDVLETFAGITSNGHPDCMEGHPTDGHTWGSGILSRAYAGDVNPIGAGFGCFNTAAGATLVSWPIYKFPAANMNIHPKHFDTLMTAGPYKMKSISGPGSSLTTAQSDWWKGCYVLVANECRTGSVAGEFYFSAPNLYYTQSMGPLALQEITVGDSTANLQNAVQNIWPSPANYTDPNTSQFTGIRTFMTTGYQYKGLGNTANCWSVPNGLSMVCSSSFAPNIARTLSLTPIFPAPPTYDGVNRKTFVAKTIAFPIQDVTLNGKVISPGEPIPMGTAKVAVKFGYNPTLYPSQNRAETGYTVSPTISESTPYLWASEWTGQGVPCATSCTVPIPSVWGEVVRYQACYLDSMGAIISCGTQRMEQQPSNTVRYSNQMFGRSKGSGRARFIQ